MFIKKLLECPLFYQILWSIIFIFLGICIFVAWKVTCSNDGVEDEGEEGEQDEKPLVFKPEIGNPEKKKKKKKEQSCPAPPSPLVPRPGDVLL